MNLASEHLEDLRRSGLSEATITLLLFEAVPPSDIKIRGVISAYLIPYFNLDGSVNGHTRMKLFPQIKTDKGTMKYWQPPKTTPHLYLPPIMDWQAVAKNPMTTLVVTEGEKKAACACQHGLITVGIGGVWCWTFTLDNGDRRTLPMLDEFQWTDRLVLICPDSDGWQKDKGWNILAGFFALAKELQQRGANVQFVVLPNLHGVKCGLDDWLPSPGNDAEYAWPKLERISLDDARFASLNGWWQKWKKKQTMLSAAVEDPEPIFLDAMQVPTFPPKLITVPWWCDMVEAVAAATETPVELPLMLSIGVVSTTIQKKYVVEPESGYIEPLNIWVCPALDSGNRKTKVLQEVAHPLLEFERQYAANLAPEITRATSTRQLNEDRIKYLRQKAAKADGPALDVLRQEIVDEIAVMPVVPTELRLWAQDVTQEKLGALMAEHGEKMAILSDEGGPFDNLAGRYSDGVPNLDLFVQAYSGSSHRVDRGSRPSVFMANPALTIALSPQPAVLRGLAKIPGFRGRGLLARFFFVLPKSTLGYRTLEARPVPAEVRANYSTHIHALLKQAPREDGRPHTLRFSPEAYREWKVFQRHVEDELRDGGRFEHIRDWAAKLPGGMARVAGILHGAEYAGRDPECHLIGLSTMEAVLDLGALLEWHALAAFSLMSVDSTVESAQKVWGWIVRERQGTFSKGACFQALKGSYPTMADLHPAFRILVERNYIFPLPHESKVGRPSERYRVNHRFINKEWQ